MRRGAPDGYRSKALTNTNTFIFIFRCWLTSGPAQLLNVERTLSQADLCGGRVHTTSSLTTNSWVLVVGAVFFLKKNPSIKIFPLDHVFGYSNEFRPLLLTWPKTRTFKNTFERPLGILHSEPLKTRMQQSKRTHSEASCLFVQAMP